MFYLYKIIGLIIFGQNFPIPAIVMLWRILTIFFGQSNMERSKTHKVHISTTQEVSESRENYTKVVMQKQMLLPYNNNNNSKKKQQDLKSEKEIKIQDHQTTASITQEQSSSRYAPRSSFFRWSTCRLGLFNWLLNLVIYLKLIKKYCSYQLSNSQNDNYFHSKWRLFSPRSILSEFCWSCNNSIFFSLR